jgi:PleD family two-component response regulator
VQTCSNSGFDTAVQAPSPTLQPGIIAKAQKEYIFGAEKAQREQQNDEKSDTPIAKDSEGLQVLLVEDNEINLKLLVAYMRKLNLSHTTACNGLEAVNAYKEAHKEGRHFDVIFMGMYLPLQFHH